MLRAARLGLDDGLVDSLDLQLYLVRILRRFLFHGSFDDFRLCFLTAVDDGVLHDQRIDFFKYAFGCFVLISEFVKLFYQIFIGHAQFFR